MSNRSQGNDDQVNETGGNSYQVNHNGGEEDDVVLLDDEDVLIGADKCVKSLIGRIFAIRTCSVDTMENALRAIWNNLLGKVLDVGLFEMRGKEPRILKAKFVAVATHLPGSSYHKMGVPLTGRALAIQFPKSSSEFPASDGVCWNNEETIPIIDISRRRRRRIEASSEKSAQIKRHRGRPKKSSKEVVCSSNSENQAVQPLAVQVLEDSAKINFSDPADGNKKVSALQSRKLEIRELGFHIFETTHRGEIET
ncbi:hypothetical protein PIB30_018253 [Stylosanthes scabra]|uniref:Uncharacterized protein n=1 Tax=Stylosanthes scabra TaxID=79078 RepID=A0ABU6W7T7_9FABA|nr:hypothetical protein [Stylosanthes scabra]